MTVTGSHLGDPIMYSVARLFMTRGLRDGMSVFAPDVEVWNAANFTALTAKFVESPDTSDRKYIEKLRDQLAGASDAQKQLMAELHFFYLLPSGSVLSQKRREIVETILSWMTTPVAVPEDVAVGYDVAHIRPGQYWASRRDLQIAFLVRFGAHWSTAVTEARRVEALDEAWAFKGIVDEIDEGGASAQRALLLHLAFPEVFEPISSMAHKRAIVDRWREYAGDSDDLDQQLFAIREVLSQSYGEGFDYYGSTVLPAWRRLGSKDDGGQDDPGHQRTVVVYLTDASARNYEHGGRDGRWAFRNKPSETNTPEVGDRVVFIFKAARGEQLSIPVDRGVSGDLRFGVLIAV